MSTPITVSDEHFKKLMAHTIWRETEVLIEAIPSCVEATGRAVASGSISPDKAPSFLEDLTHKAWELIGEARRHE